MAYPSDRHEAHPHEIGVSSKTTAGHKIRAKAADCIRARRSGESIRRVDTSGLDKKGYSCGECARFAALLKQENVSKTVLMEASKHRFICEPTPTPQNLWEPWSIPPTNPSENQLSS